MSDPIVSPPPLAVRAAVDADLPALHALNVAGEPGVGPIDPAGLRALIAQSAATLVAVDGATPLGFLLLLGPGADYASPNYAFFQARHGPAGRFLYVDRIAVDAAARGRGVGAALYAALAARGTGGGPLCCEVNTLPPNPGSLRFHTRLGFESVGERVHEPGRKAVVYLERRP